ncbi:MAG: NFACT family protein [Oscillospiraceae bacterium]|nr:NFACT family protein [Oscillospiraceae bacterium]
MPLDAVCLSAVVNELSDVLKDARVDKVQQPERDELIISLRTKQDNVKLLVSAGTGDARIHFTKSSYENPAQPPMFCMLLRKHLVGTVLTDVQQIQGERAVVFSFEHKSIFGDDESRKLIVELMGRYSNIILTDSEGIILDCLRRVDMSMSEKRQVLPGLFYRNPPPQEKISIFAATAEDLENAIERAQFGKSLDKLLLDTFSGISPLGCREIVNAAYGITDVRAGECDTTPLVSAFASAVDFINAKKFTPCIVKNAEGRLADFYCFPLKQYGTAAEILTFDSFSECLEEFYTGRARAERVRQRSATMTKTVKNARDRLSRKLLMQNEELKKTFDRERLRECGDIISANMHAMKKGQSVLRAFDFYDPEGKECEIALDPAKSPQQNAAKYYKDYTKAKNAEKALTEQIINGEAELEYLESVLEEIERAGGERDLSEIRAELESTGYLKQQKKNAKQKPQKFEPMRFVSSTGFEIRVGKNNTQNDQLTLKHSSKLDIWLHTQKIHGSHVIITTNGYEVDETTLTEAAQLAALYSKASEGSNVPVDFCLVKFVKKPVGAKPGMVIYTDYKTLFVTPDKTLPDRLKGGK